MDVLFTVDVEIWCDGWTDIDRKFPECFRKYIYGPTRRGDFGLPYKLKVLGDHGLLGVFFVEPLFATRFGEGPLQEIVGLIREAGHEVQLHLHTEWVDESREPLIADCGRKRQHLRYYTLEEQATLLGAGRELLARNGAEGVNAFRAGSFGFNADTLTALERNGIRFDSSYNATQFGPDSGVMAGTTLVQPVEYNGVIEYPMTVFSDGTGALRHVQVTACSSREMCYLLRQAADRGWDAFVLLSHNFELMNRAKDRHDPVAVSRFHRLCAFLDRHRDTFRTTGFRGLAPTPRAEQPPPLATPRWTTLTRTAVQGWRRVYG